MLFAWFKKHVGFKIALFTTLALLVVTGILLVVVAGFGAGFVSRLNLFSTVALVSLVFLFLQMVVVWVTTGAFITKPLVCLNRSIKSVTDGNLKEHCELSSGDEFGQLSLGLNAMLESLVKMNEQRKSIERRLLVAEEGLKYKSALEDKAKIIERMNTELSGVFSDLSLLYTVSQYLNSILEFDDLVNRVSAVFQDRFLCDGFAFFLADGTQQTLRLVAHKGVKDPPADTEFMSMSGAGIAGQTLKRQCVLYIADLAVWPGDERASWESSFQGSVLSLPLSVRGDIVGVLSIYRGMADGFSPTDRQSLESIGNQIAIAYDRAVLYSKTKELSVRDELTGVYNRRHFQEMLHLEFKRAQRFKRDLSLLVIDIDHFKQFNDTYGHIKGDELLRGFTRLLARSLREIDLLARFGGDEFVLLLINTPLKDAVVVGEKLRRVVRDELWKLVFQSDSILVRTSRHVTVSVGVAAFPECAGSQEELMNMADVALYQSKKDGRDAVRAHEVVAPSFEQKKA